MLEIFKDREFRFFLLKFIFFFGLFYLGSIAIIGLAAEDGYYSPTVARYFDYIDWIRIALIKGTKALLGIFNIDTYQAGYNLRQVNGRGVLIAYDCVGYGVMSFWAAFVLASRGTLLKKVGWIILGFILIYLINIIRIGLLLVAINKNWGMPLGIDHHTWFNIFAYGLIFYLIYLFNKPKRIKTKTTLTHDR